MKNLPRFNCYRNINFIDLLYPTCTVLPYTNTFESIKINDSYMVEMKIHQMRKAAECHRQVREYIQPYLKVGVKLYDICNLMENKINYLIGTDKTSGVAFPTCISRSEIVADSTPFLGDNQVLDEDGVFKIDFGTHIDGYIIDSAFSINLNNKYESLINAASESMWNAIKLIGVDADIDDISREIQETIESYEITLNGKNYKITSIGMLGGHNITQYKLHAGTIILGKPGQNAMNNNNGNKIKSNTCYAIETFPIIGESNLHNGSMDQCNNYMVVQENPSYNFKNKITRKMFLFIKNKYKGMPFCTRWLYDKFNEEYKIGIDELFKNNIIHGYPPLFDNMPTAQMEHTIYVHEFGKEILSHGEDY